MERGVSESKMVTASTNDKAEISRARLKSEWMGRSGAFPRRRTLESELIPTTSLVPKARADSRQ